MRRVAMGVKSRKTAEALFTRLAIERTRLY
ncbi:protein of unknown function [Hyphomicrobium sp. 1Nfss2.1]